MIICSILLVAYNFWFSMLGFVFVQISFPISTFFYLTYLHKQACVRTYLRIGRYVCALNNHSVKLYSLNHPSYFQSILFVQCLFTDLSFMREAYISESVSTWLVPCDVMMILSGISIPTGSGPSFESLHF